MADREPPGTADGPVAKFYADLEELRKSSGRKVPALAPKLRLSEKQLYAILAGNRKTPPDWVKFVRPLVQECTNGDAKQLAAWERRHERVVDLYEELKRQQRKTAPTAGLGPATPTPKVANSSLDATAAKERGNPALRESSTHTPRADAQAGESRVPGGDQLTEVGRLAITLSTEWTSEFNARKFNDQGYELTVSWTAEPTLMNSWEYLVDQAVSGFGAQKDVRPDPWADSAQELKGSGHDLAAVLDRVPTGWLVVLGEKGSGKSMLMLQLVIDLIKKRDSGAPVPVFVPMTTWDPAKDKLARWLEKQLPRDYPRLEAEVPGEQGRRSRIADLLARQKIVPILDGLDEMSPDLRRRAVDMLNKSFDSPDRPLRLVVTCRTAEYTAIADPADGPWNPINAAAAIKLQPFSGAEVAQYLSRKGKDHRWAKVVELLSGPAGPSPLRETLETPLYACLASAIYNPRHHSYGPAPDPDDLRTKYHDPASIQHHLLDEFIPAMYQGERDAEERRAREERRPPARLPAERRLMFIARSLKARDSTMLEWWNLEGLAPAWACKWLPATVVGVVCGIAVGLAAALGTHVGVGIGLGFGVGLLIAEAVGLGVRHAWGRWGKEGFKRRFERPRPGPGMAGGIIGAVLGSLGAGIAGKYHIGHEPSLFSGVPEALGIAIGAGSTTDFPGGLFGALFGSFVAGYLAAVGLGLPAGIVNGLGTGIAAAVAIKYLGRRAPSIGPPVWEKHIGIPAGLVVGLVIGLIAWREIGAAGGIVAGLLIAAAASVPLGMRYRDEDLDAAPSPGRTMARDASDFRLTALWAGLATGSVGFIGGAMTSIFEVGAKPSLTDFIRDGLGIGLSAGLVVGLCFGFYHAAYPDFRILNWWLAGKRKVPLRFGHFLDDAHQKTVLRQIGARYEFRHVVLRDRLAARPEKD
jgi:NACHT domain-containing protein